ncbi:hypothetical protein BD408DRAFT_217080 [Parasitella parasitica]|nr:hypothetical protein BD408DRAFT_217080 [Parasitella parasitica]
MPLSLTIDSIDSWVTEGSSHVLNVLSSKSKNTIVKRGLYVGNKDQGVELVMMEISDGEYFIPALFNIDDVRERFGLSNLLLSTDSLKEKALVIKTYSISALRINGSIYPYVIVVDFDCKPTRIAIADDLRHAHTHKTVENWLNLVQQNIHNLKNPMSVVFPSAALKAKYPRLSFIEGFLEAMLSMMYTYNRAPLPSHTKRKNKSASEEVQGQTKRRRADATSDRLRNSNYESNSSRPSLAYQQYQKRAALQFDSLTEIPDNLCIAGYEEVVDQTIAFEPSSYAVADYNEHGPSSPVATPGELASAPLSKDCNSPAHDITLHDHMLSMFDTLDEIPDLLCIASNNNVIFEPKNRPVSPVPHPPSMIDTPATPTTPEPAAPSTSPSVPLTLDGSIKTERTHVFVQVPEDFDDYQRRRFFSRLRLQYLL